MSLRVVTLHLGEDVFCVEIDCVQEVLVEFPMTRVPLGPTAIVGLINLRGQVVTVFDLRRILGYPPAPPELERVQVVVSTSYGLVSLLVDREGDYYEFANSPQPLPGNFQEQLAALLIGVVEGRDRELLMVLHIEKTLAPETLTERAHP